MAVPKLAPVYPLLVPFGFVSASASLIVAIAGFSITRSDWIHDITGSTSYLPAGEIISACYKIQIT